jgi:hypothetical protein
MHIEKEIKLILIDDDYKQFVDKLNAWASTFSVIERDRVFNTCLIVFYVLLPKKDETKTDAYEVFAKIILWLFAIDDYLDSLDNLGQNSLILERPLDLFKEKDFSVFHEMLFHIHERLPMPKHHHLSEFWLEIYQTTIRAMLFEVGTKTSSERLSFDKYMSMAQYSIGTPLVFVTLWYFVLDHSFLDEKLTRLFDKFRSLYQVTRLLNDVRSFDKEFREGKKNSLSILMGVGHTFSRSNSIIDQKIESLMVDLRRSYSDSSFDTVSMLAYRIAYFTYYFYKKSDFNQKLKV